MNLQSIPVIVNEAHLPEPVHEKTNPRPGGAHHLCEELEEQIADLRRVRLTADLHQRKTVREAYIRIADDSRSERPGSWVVSALETFQQQAHSLTIRPKSICFPEVTSETLYCLAAFTS